MNKILNKLSFLGKVPHWAFFGLFLSSALICVMALRHNNLTMTSLRDQLYAADKSGKNVEQALDNLRGYVYGHMNTNLSGGGNSIKPPIQLKYTYDRLVAAEQAKAKSSNTQLYTEAQNYCQSINKAYYGTTRVPCVQQYVSTHGTKAAQPKTIPPELYQFDFVSPAWSPDLAGWSLVATIVFFLAFITNFIRSRLFRYKP